jgi:hypothetical protein
MFVTTFFKMFGTATNTLIVGRRGSGKEAFVANLLKTFQKTMHLDGAIACNAKKTPLSYNGVLDTKLIFEDRTPGNVASALYKAQDMLQSKGLCVPRVALILDQSSDWWSKYNAGQVLELLKVANRLNVILLLCVFDVGQVPKLADPFIDVVCFAKDEFNESITRSYKRFGSTFPKKTEYRDAISRLTKFEFLCVDQRADATVRTDTIVSVKQNVAYSKSLDSGDKTDTLNFTYPTLLTILGYADYDDKDNKDNKDKDEDMIEDMIESK